MTTSLENICLLLKTGYIKKDCLNLKKNIQLLIKLFFLLLCFKLIYLWFSFLLEWLNIIKMPTNSALEKIDNLPYFEQVIVITVLSPVLEELTFRIGLKFSKLNLLIMILGINFIIFKSFFEMDWYKSFFLTLISGILFCLYIEKKSKELRRFWLNNKKNIFYTLLLSFSFLHLHNYKFSFELLLLSPIIILPRIFGGLIYSYTRFKLGIVSAIMMHILNNTFPLIINSFII